MSKYEYCKRCGGPLDFAGFDRTGRRVTICLNSLGVKRKDGTGDSVPCNGQGLYTVGEKSFPTITWWSSR